MAKQTNDYKYTGRSGGVTALTTSMADIATAGAEGSDVTEFTICNSGVSARSVTIEISDGTDTAIIFLVSVPASTGNSTTQPAIDTINGGSVSAVNKLPGVELIGTVNIYPLPPNMKLRAKQDVGTDCSIVWKMKDY
jgi:hypothetical protein